MIARQAVVVLALAGAVLGAGCAGEQFTQPTGASRTPGPATRAPEATPTPSPVAPQPSDARPVNPEGGQQYWVLYLAAGKPGDPALSAALQEARRLGFVTEPHLLGCDLYAADRLGLTQYHEAVAFYFTSEADAQAFGSRLRIDPVGVMQATANPECALG